MVEPAVDSQIVQIDDVQMLVETTAVDPAAVTTQLPEAPPQAAQNAARTASAREPAPADNGGSRRTVDADVRAPRTDTSGRFARVKPPEVKPAPSPPSQLQKIIAVRVCAIADGSWDGTDLATAFAGSDLVHGRYGVFHRLHSDGRSIFCVASLVEPGSFDPQRMPEQRFPAFRFSLCSPVRWSRCRPSRRS